MIFPGFVSGSYVSVSPNVATEVLQNWMPQTVEVPYEKAKLVLLNTPGLRIYVTLTDTPVRGIFSQDGRTFAVGGLTVFEVTGGVVTNLGTLSAADANPVTMCSSGTAGHQVFITSAGAGNILDTVTNTVSAITAVGYPSNTKIGTYLDSYFLTTKGNTAQFNVSGLLDGTTWSTLDFSIRIAASDNLVGIQQTNKLIWLIGSRTSEPWYDAGILSFPFLAVPQVLVPIGCCAPSSIFRIDAGGSGSVGWLHQTERGNGQFVATQGYQPQRFSTYAVERIWSTYPTLTDCVTFPYSDGGHQFVVCTFPSGNATWVYDFTESKWHARSWYNAATGNDDRQRQWVHAFDGTRHLVGDWQTGAIYAQDNTVATDGETLIRRVRRSPHASSEQVMNFYSNFQLDCETGLANITGTGSAPTFLLQWSDDGGHTFNSGISLSAGATGDYRFRCRAAGSLGQSRDRVFQISTSDPIPSRILQAYVTVAAGTS